MLNNYSIIYRDLEFEGLKFRHSKSYGEGEFDSLLDEGSQYSEIRCQKGLDREALERIHICLSYGGLLKVLTFTLIGFAFILAPLSVLWGSVLLATFKPDTVHNKSSFQAKGSQGLQHARNRQQLD